MKYRKISIIVIKTLIPLTWKIWWAPNNASKWQMGFNWAFKGLMGPRKPSRTQKKIFSV